MSVGTLSIDGCAVKAQSISGCSDPLTETRNEGLSCARRKTYFPPQQNPAVPTLRAELSRDARMAVIILMMRPRTTDCLLVAKKGIRSEAAYLKG